ncbi:MAG: hypothetical protein GKR89_09110 [Candidatus Latescibacteria bacterium]|nr:hypothetical protein [Candidatus Latescibacterota bacterium]
MWRKTIWTGLLVAGCSQNYSDKQTEQALEQHNLQDLSLQTQGKAQAKAVPVDPVVAGEQLALGALRVSLPQGWKSVEPSNSMRLAEFILPGAGGDASLAVFHFGRNQGGTIQSNIDRWVGQFTQPDGSPIGRGARTWEADTGAGPATLVDVSGTYGGGMGGQGQQPGARMLGAIVESSNGLYFFKAVGPEATLDQWDETFAGFIAQVQAGS